MPQTVADFVTLTSNQGVFNQYTEPLMIKARDLYEAAIIPRYESAQQPEYNFLRDEQEWTRLKSAMESAVLTGRVSFPAG
jgi:hypothetical protein